MEEAQRGLDIVEQNRAEANSHQVTGTDWTAKAMIEEKEIEIKRLNERVATLEATMAGKQNEIGRLRMWQEGDKYLSEDLVLKDAIEDHRLKTLAVAEKEQKEISDAAY